MRTITLTTIVGARPQFIKAAAVSRAIAAFNERSTDVRIDERIVHTGQHYDQRMSQVFFDELQIPPPAVNLEVGSGIHGRQTGLMLERIEAYLLETRPDWVLVYGDTNSTLAGALAAAKLHIPVAHVEAGLRSFNRRMPEEVNRVLTDHLSELLLCPTDQAVTNLAAEGITGVAPLLKKGTGSEQTTSQRENTACEVPVPFFQQSNDRTGSEQTTSQKENTACKVPVPFFRTRGVHQVGDVMYDSVLFHTQQAEGTSDILSRLGLASKQYYLATLHRAENTDDSTRLDSIFTALQRCPYPVVLPLHPRTRQALGDRPTAANGPLVLTDPVSYLDMLVLEKHARIILTDSGGVQKEAYWMGVPCITLRDETEWVELVEAGCNTLAGADARAIQAAVDRFESQLAHNDPSTTNEAQVLYGDGESASQIANLLGQATVN